MEMWRVGWPLASVDGEKLKGFDTCSGDWVAPLGDK